MSIFGETSGKTSLSQTCTPKLSAEVLWHHDGAEDSTRSSDEGGLDTDGTDSDEDFPTRTWTPAAFEDKLGYAAPKSAREARPRLCGAAVQCACPARAIAIMWSQHEARSYVA